MSLQVASHPGAISAFQPHTATNNSHLSYRKPPLSATNNSGTTSDRPRKEKRQTLETPSYDRRLSDHMKRSSRNHGVSPLKIGPGAPASTGSQVTFKEDTPAVKNKRNTKPIEVDLKVQDVKANDSRAPPLRQRSSRVSTLSTIQEEERLRNRRYKFNQFLTSVWGPALQDEFAGAFRLVNTQDPASETHQDPKVIEERNRAAKLLEKKAATHTDQEVAKQRTREKQITKPRPSVNTMKTLPVIDITKETNQVHVLPPQGSSQIERKSHDVHTSESRMSQREDNWAMNVQQVLEQTKARISNEALNDPDFIKKRRESAQMRAWLATHKRASQARLSALETGRILPSTAFEKAFVAELLRENEENMKCKSSSFSEPGQSSGFSSKRSTLLPDYTPFTHYSLLMPLEEIESEARQAEVKDDKEQTVFEKRKAARRAGQEYKSFSKLTMNDQETHGSQCCELSLLWNKFGFRKGL